MIPILYESNETEFKSNGIGRLSDAIRCYVTEERNGQYELEMEYPITGIHYKDIRYGRFISAVPAYLRDPQPFEIYKITKPLNGRVTVYGQHISYRLSRIPVLPFSATSVNDALTGLKNNAAEACPFTLWTDKTTEAEYKQEKPNSLRGQLGGIEGSILDVYGGEYEWDKWTVRLWDHRGKDYGTEIRYGKNLIDLTQEENIADTVTGICPYWSGTVDNETVTVVLPEKVIETDTAKNFPYNRTSVVDVSSLISLNEDQKEPTEAQVREAAQAYIRAHSFGVPSVSLDVKFQNLEDTEEYKELGVLEQVHLCDAVTVNFEKLGVSAKATVIKTDWDVLSDKYDSIEIGNAKSSLSSTIAEQAAEMKEKPTRDFLTQAVDSATRLITGNTGGFVRLNRDASGNPYELLIMDTADITTAKNVWRFNKSGWGHSSTGYSGTYNLAATQGGAIVADMMTAGTLRGINVQGVDFYGNKKDANGNYIFHVDKDGNLNASSAVIAGTVKAGLGSAITDTVISNGNGTFSVDAAGNLNASSAVIAGTVKAGLGSAITDTVISNGNGTFSVDAAGNMVATSANIAGTINANDGKIGPWIMSGAGIWNGINIGTPGSCGLGNSHDWQFWAGNGAFRVDADGNMWANQAYIGSSAANGNSTSIGSGVITTNQINATGGTIDNLTCKHLNLSSDNGCSINAAGVTGKVTTEVVSDITSLSLERGTTQEGGEISTTIRAKITFNTKKLTLFKAKVSQTKAEKVSSYVKTS